MWLSDCFTARGALDNICDMGWQDLSQREVMRSIYAFYYFSVQFNKNLQAASDLHPDDAGVAQLKSEELNTSNLSPCAGIADDGEAMNHDEFLRRVLLMANLNEEEKETLCEMGVAYLEGMKGMKPEEQIQCLVSCEDGGAMRMYQAVVASKALGEGEASLSAFKHFLDCHIAFDSNEGDDCGHGALVRKFAITDEVVGPFWSSFSQFLKDAVDLPRGIKPQYGNSSLERHV